MSTTTYKGAYLPIVNGDYDVWGTELNTSTFPVFDANIGGYAAQSLSNANVILSAVQDQCAILRLTGMLTANVQVTTACQGFKLVENLTTGNFTVTLTNGAGASLVLPQNTPSHCIIDATNGVRLASNGVPAGFIGPYAGGNAPAGWALCNGQAISRTTFASLFNAIGTSYGAGDGSTTFNLPDLRGRSIFGLDNMGGTPANRLTGANAGNIASPTTLGAAGGEENHAVSIPELPAHTHSITDPGHIHFLFNIDILGDGAAIVNSSNYTAVTFRPSGSSYAYVMVGDSTLPTIGMSSTSTTGVTNANTGGGGSHNNIPPAMVMNWIIKF